MENTKRILEKVEFHDLSLEKIIFDSEHSIFSIEYSVYHEKEEIYNVYILSFRNVTNVHIDTNSIILGDMEIRSFSYEEKGTLFNANIIIGQGFSEREIGISFDFKEVKKQGIQPRE
jgi:hypothetical protein